MLLDDLSSKRFGADVGGVGVPWHLEDRDLLAPHFVLEPQASNVDMSRVAETLPVYDTDRGAGVDF